MPLIVPCHSGYLSLERSAILICLSNLFVSLDFAHNGLYLFVREPGQYSEAVIPIKYILFVNDPLCPGYIAV